MIKVYDTLLTILKPIITFIGKCHWPFTHKKINGSFYYRWRDKIDIGTVFLTKTRGEISNVINPNELKHGAIYVGNILGGEIRYVAEAVGAGVVLTDLVTFLLTKDIVVMMRPNFIESKDIFNTLLQEEVKKVYGIPYDYLFNQDGKSFYCFELVATMFNRVYPGKLNLEIREFVKDKQIYDYKTFLDERYFKLIVDSRKEYNGK